MLLTVLGSKGNSSSTSTVPFHFGEGEPLFTERRGRQLTIGMGNKCPGCSGEAVCPLGEKCEQGVLCVVCGGVFVICGMSCMWCVYM